MTPSELNWTVQADYPILASLQLLPLLAMLLVSALRDGRAVLRLGVIFALLELALAIDLYRHFDPLAPAMQLAEWIDLPGPLNYHVAADGMTVLFVLLAAVLTLLLTLYGPIRPLLPSHRFTSLVFAGQAALMSLLLTMDLAWFVAVSALQLLPVGYLLWRWSTSPEKDLALIRFLQFMGSGVLLLCTGALILGWHHGDIAGRVSFDLFDLLKTPLPAADQSLVFFLLFYGLAIRTPLFPLHGWLPRIAEHGSVAAAPVFLLGLKIGIYGLLRFVFPLLPEAVMQWHGYVVAFAAAGIFYAALLALMQDNLRRLLAFAVVSHTSVLVIGLFSLNHAAFQGGLLLSVNFGLAIAGLLFITGAVYSRTGTAQLTRMGGLFDRIPLLGITFLLAGLSIVGMPGTPGFDAAHLMLEAAIHEFGAMLTIAAALGNVVAAGFLLLAFQRAFLAQGGSASPEVARTRPLETVLAGLIICCLLGAGFWSEPWLELVETSTQQLSAPFRQAGP